MSSDLDIPAPTTDVPLGQRATRAFGWSFVNTAVSRLGTLAIGIALARLLGPESFGTFAVATVALLAILSFSELGVSLAIVRWRGDPAEIAPTVTTVSVVSSACLLGLVMLGAPAFTAAMGDPAATPVVRLMAVALLVNGLVATPAALLQREFRQGRRMVVDQINTWLGAIVSLVLALLGMGAMSLAIGRIAGSLVSGVFFIAWSPLPYRFGFDRRVARALLRFGLPLAGASFVVFLVGYADQLMTGALLGSTALGFYVLAFNLASWPVSIFSQPLRSVAPAAFARLQHDPERLHGAFVDFARLLAAVALPSCFLLAGAAAPLIRIVYGPVWSAAAAVLTFLAVQAVARILFELAYDFLVITGASHRILFVQLGWLILAAPALLLGARLDGLRGIAAAQAAVAVLAVLPAYAVLLRQVGLPLARLTRQLAPAVVVGLLVGGTALALSAQFESDVLACAVAGLVALGGVAVLVSRTRDVIARVRALREVTG